MNGLIVTQDHGYVWTWASTGAHVKIHGSDTAAFSNDLHGS